MPQSGSNSESTTNTSTKSSKPKSWDDYVIDFIRAYGGRAIAGDGKRKTIIIRLGTFLAIPLALATGLYYYYSRGPTEKLKNYYRRLEDIYDYDYLDEDEEAEPAWSSSSWILLLGSLVCVVGYAFRSLLWKPGSRGGIQGYGDYSNNQTGGPQLLGEGLRQWAPSSGGGLQGTPNLHNMGDSGGGRLGMPPGFTNQQESAMNQDFHKRRLNNLNSSVSGRYSPNSDRLPHQMGDRYEY